MRARLQYYPCLYPAGEPPLAAAHDSGGWLHQDICTITRNASGGGARAVSSAASYLRRRALAHRLALPSRGAEWAQAMGLTLPRPCRSAQWQLCCGPRGLRRGR